MARDGEVVVEGLEVGTQIVAVHYDTWKGVPSSIVTESITKLTKTRVVTNRSRFIIRNGVINGSREGDSTGSTSLYRSWDLRLVAIRGEAETYRLLQNARQAAGQFAKSPTRDKAVALQEVLQAWLERNPDE